MSWDVLLLSYKSPGPVEVGNISEGDVLPLGTAVDVRTLISALVPGVSWSDPTWGVFDLESLSIEFSIGNDEHVDSCMLHVRGIGNVMPTIKALLSVPGWQGMDMTTGDFLDPGNPSETGWKKFQEYRDGIVARADCITE